MPKQDKPDSPNFLSMDDYIEQALLQKRRILISDSIDFESAGEIIRKLWYLEAQDPKKPITLVINSPGGSVDAGFAIWDQAKLLQTPIITLITGLAASMGSVLSLCASPGKRYATPMARIMIHQPMIGGVIKGQATDLDIQAKEMLKTRDILVRIYVEATGKDYKTIDKAVDRDTWMSVEEALEYGLIDKIVESIESVK